MNSVRMKRLKARIEPMREALLSHGIYGRINGIAGLRCFMEYHVFAVWDFMSLLKALQRSLCCVDVPWVPVPDAAACRMVNEIVLAEEADEDGRGGYSSHFELYRQAMHQYGADIRPVDRLVESIRSGMSLDCALDAVVVPGAVREFVENSFGVIASGDVCAIAAAFTFGREGLLPDVFRKIVDGLEPTTEGEWDAFRYYLDRHIEIDGGDHGPIGESLVEKLCGDSSDRWLLAEDTAVRALEARVRLWDGVSERIGRDAGAWL
jgi:Protein of unknown function (DUF3050)